MVILMGWEILDPIIAILPDVKRPVQRPPLKTRLMWVGIALTIFFILSVVTPVGLLTPARLAEIQQTDPAKYLILKEQYSSILQRVAFLENVQTILASRMGTLGTLGIGPIVMASIILQLLVGAEIIQMDKKRYMAATKVGAILFAFFEAFVYVASGFLPIEPTGISLLPIPGLSHIFDTNALLVMFQIAMGSIILLFLDEVVSKWGIGSGIGLFIVGGVSQTVVYRAISPSVGSIPAFINTLINEGTLSFDLIGPLIATIIVFLIVVYGEGMRIEIPLTLGRISGVGGRFPLKLFYVSNIPVILAAALFANIQLFANVLYGMGLPWLGRFGPNGQPLPDLVLSLDPSQFTIPIAWVVRAPYGVLSGWTALYQNFINPAQTVFGFIPLALVHLVLYLIFMIAACIMFGMFWVETTGMGPKQVARQLQSAGLAIPGFRRDPRVIERVLERYIPMVTILGSAAVGGLAALADLTGAYGTGTGILLSVGILYRLYEELMAAQLAELHPALKSFLG